MALYNKYNQPFRSLVRTCGGCEQVELQASPLPLSDLISKRRAVDTILPLLTEIVCENDNIDCYGYSLLGKFKAESQISLQKGRVSIAHLYDNLIEALEYLISKG